jgi:hypothetical protein
LAKKETIASDFSESTILWDMALCSLVEVYQHFKRMYSPSTFRIDE